MTEAAEAYALGVAIEGEVVEELVEVLRDVRDALIADGYHEPNELIEKLNFAIEEYGE